MSTPELRIEHVPSICSYGPRPRLMNGLFVQLLRQLFAAPDLLEEPALRGGSAPAFWTADPLTSGISIELATTWKPSTSMARPALVIRRDPWQVQRQGIGDRLMGYGANSDGSESFATFITGSHTIFAIGNDDAPEDIAAEVYRGMIEFGPVNWPQYQLHRFVVASIGSMGRLQEAGDAYAVPITVAYAFEQSWRITRQAPYLQRVTISTNLET